jgi:hypothetical protein
VPHDISEFLFCFGAIYKDVTPPHSNRFGSIAFADGPYKFVRSLEQGMKRFTFYSVSVAVLLSVQAFSQRVEIFGGAQFEHLQPSYNAVGWNASLTGNFKHVLGITGDFSGVYRSRHGTDTSVYTYTAGPVLQARLPVVQPFVHALFGGASRSVGGVNENAFAMFLGGGLDLGFRRGIAFRLVQADWMMTKFADDTQDKQGRVSAGIVIKF